MNTPEQGYRRTRIATAAVAALGVTVLGGSASLAYLGTHQPEVVTTATQTDASAHVPSFGSAPRVTAPGVGSPNSASSSGTTHARTHGS
ncbi:hypothetical protein [Rhodococcus sp. KRD162]|uniref:hypothetical protein n=1 Tax=unclassified Rhodococcus (in: high G+C Gram-positive bacteria) TaxID=192944 RepID=UPI0019D16FC1|nr:hypothetical protein [Rhodococcus sp. KRD162]